MHNFSATSDATMKTFPALKGIHPTVCMDWGIFGLGNPFGDEAALQWVLQQCMQGGTGCDLLGVRTVSGMGTGTETGVVSGLGKGTGRRTGSETRAGEEEGVGEGECNGTETGRSKERGISAKERESGGTGSGGEGEREGEGEVKGRESGMVVYGSGLSAIAAVSGLVKNNIPPHLITLVIPEEELEELGHPTVCPVATVF
jgi:hypothetical protein